jgi:RNA polymerase sigma-70 factor (ECF subfamily)
MRSVDVDQPWPQLSARAPAGDERAFAGLWRRHQPSLLRYLEIVAGRVVAEDLAAETWLSVVRALPRFEGTEPGFKALLFTTARSRVIDGVRRARARPQASDEIDGLDGLEGLDARLVATTADETSRGLEQAEATRRALDLIARLPAGQAEVVALRVIAGLDNTEIARITGKQPGAVRVAYSRGVATLARMVDGATDVTDPDRDAFRVVR